jgi:AcrR family transcriptional regulator
MAQTASVTAARATQERSRDTQARILNAAITALVNDGYSGATTLRIQAIAGVSRGRLLHHYPSRDDLLVAAVSHLTEARMSALAKDQEWPSDPAERIDVALDRMWETFHQEYFWASTELWLAARANPRLREALEPHERKLGTFIVGKVGNMFGEQIVQREGYAMMRDLLIAGMRGVALSYAFRPRDPRLDPHLPQWKAIARASLLDRDLSL